MFGVEYLKNPWREKFDFFSKKSPGFIFGLVENPRIGYILAHG